MRATDAVGGVDDTSGGALESAVHAAFPGLDRTSAEHALRLLYRLALLVKKRQRLDPGHTPPWTAATLWPEICARTDELYELSERCQDDFGRVCRRILEAECGQKPFHSGKYAGFMDGGLKDPVRTHEKALDDYAARFEDGVLPEACVTDMVRARVVFTEASAFRKLAVVLQQGYREERDAKVWTLTRTSSASPWPDGPRLIRVIDRACACDCSLSEQVVRLELVRGKNKFSAPGARARGSNSAVRAARCALAPGPTCTRVTDGCELGAPPADPSHFRTILYNVLLIVDWTVDGEPRQLRCFCEIQAHHLFILKLNDELHGQRHYEFFRRHLRHGYDAGVRSNLDFMLETRMVRRGCVAHCPRLLAAR